MLGFTVVLILVSIVCGIFDPSRALVNGNGLQSHEEQASHPGLLNGKSLLLSGSDDSSLRSSTSAQLTSSLSRLGPVGALNDPLIIIQKARGLDPTSSGSLSTDATNNTQASVLDPVAGAGSQSSLDTESTSNHFSTASATSNTEASPKLTVVVNSSSSTDVSTSAYSSPTIPPSSTSSGLSMTVSSNTPSSSVMSSSGIVKVSSTTSASGSFEPSSSASSLGVTPSTSVSSPSSSGDNGTATNSGETAKISGQPTATASFANSTGDIWPTVFSVPPILMSLPPTTATSSTPSGVVSGGGNTTSSGPSSPTSTGVVPTATNTLPALVSLTPPAVASSPTSGVVSDGGNSSTSPSSNVVSTATSVPPAVISLPPTLPSSTFSGLVGGGGNASSSDSAPSSSNNQVSALPTSASNTSTTTESSSDTQLPPILLPFPTTLPTSSPSGTSNTLTATESSSDIQLPPILLPFPTTLPTPSPSGTSDTSTATDSSSDTQIPPILLPLPTIQPTTLTLSASTITVSLPSALPSGSDEPPLSQPILSIFSSIESLFSTSTPSLSFPPPSISPGSTSPSTGDGMTSTDSLPTSAGILGPSPTISQVVPSLLPSISIPIFSTETFFTPIPSLGFPFPSTNSGNPSPSASDDMTSTDSLPTSAASPTISQVVPSIVPSISIPIFSTETFFTPIPSLSFPFPSTDPGNTSPSTSDGMTSTDSPPTSAGSLGPSPTISQVFPSIVPSISDPIASIPVSTHDIISSIPAVPPVSFSQPSSAITEASSVAGIQQPPTPTLAGTGTSQSNAMTMSNGPSTAAAPSVLSSLSNIILFPPSALFPSVIMATSSSLTTPSAPSAAVSAQFSFITASNLLTTQPPITSVSDTLRDPDAAPTTSTVSSAATPSIPASLPRRIFLPNSVDPTTQADLLVGKQLISILFQDSLNWNFVSNNMQTQGQVFAFMPQVIANALSMDPSDIVTYALQVQVPQDWDGDANTLGSVFLAYIPQNDTDTLALMIRAPSSKFYALDGIPGQLANAVVPSFPMTAVKLDVVPGVAQSSNTSSSAKRRGMDSIIGICAAAVGLSLIIAIWWAVRYMRRKAEAKHRRIEDLCDPSWNGGIYATHSDERRTSFFYAQDQLQAGYYAVPPASAPRVPPPGSIGAMAIQRKMGAREQPRRRSHMRQVSISAPVLQFSTVEC